MAKTFDKRHSIGEVSEMTGVARHLLRQWEEKFPQLRPKRNRSDRRFYLQADIDVVKRIHFFLRHEKMTIEGARLRLAQELHGEGRPRTRKEALDLLDKIDDEVRSALHTLGAV